MSLQHDVLAHAADVYTVRNMEAIRWRHLIHCNAELVARTRRQPGRVNLTRAHCRVVLMHVRSLLEQYPYAP